MNNDQNSIRTNIKEYLEVQENKELLRFITCGNVDDGKSTLIGRLLYDSQLIFEDQLNALKRDSVRGTVKGGVDYSLLMDGLQSEREQGITIDVSYRYFTTTKRKFIIADTPGHEQYTRNMATGASTANLAVILIDARNGVQTQTKRHSYIAYLLGIKHFIVAINKMDLIDYSEQKFEEIRKDYTKFANNLGITDMHFIPLSALYGENLIEKSDKLSWYQGETLLYYLENIDITYDVNHSDFRFPVQYVNRPDLHFRGVSGTIASGAIKVGDKVIILPSQQRSTVKSIVVYKEELQEAYAQMAITLVLQDEIDVSRGDCIVKEENMPEVSKVFDAFVIWMHDTILEKNKTYYIKQGTKVVQGSVEDFYYKKNVNTLEEEECEALHINEVGVVQFQVSENLIFDDYYKNRQTGRFIIIDRISNNTVGVGMIMKREVVSFKTSKTRVRKANFIEKTLHSYVKKRYPHWEVKELD